MSLIWFRYHASALDNPRVQGLSSELFRTWINLQCILAQEKTAASGKLPKADDLSFRLRKSVEETVRNLEDLVKSGLLKSKCVTDGDGNGDESVTDGDGNGHQNSLEIFQQEKEYFLKNWGNKQYKSDSSSERTKRYRERHRTVTVTAPDQIRSDTEQIRSERRSFQSEIIDKKEQKSARKIETFLYGDDINKAKAAAPGWDIYHLMRTFDEFIANKEFPRKPAPAFIAWCKKFTKGKTP